MAPEWAIDVLAGLAGAAVTIVFTGTDDFEAEIGRKVAVIIKT